MALPQALSLRTSGQGLRDLQAHQRDRKYQLVAFGIPVAVVQAAVEEDFVAAAEVLVFVVPGALPVGLVVLLAEKKMYIYKLRLQQSFSYNNSEISSVRTVLALWSMRV